MRSLIGRLAAGFVLCVTLSGCYSSYVFRSNVQPSTTGTTVLVHTFIYGIVSLNGVDAASLCGDQEIYSVRSRIAGLGILASFVTGGLWAPMSVTVVCGAPMATPMTQAPALDPAPSPTL